MTIFRILLLGATLAGATTAFAELSRPAPLEADEGYLVVGVSLEHIAFTAISIDGGGSLGYAHKFRANEFTDGVNYKIIRLPAGRYFWRHIQLQNYGYFGFDKDEFPMTVEPGKISYGGILFGRAVGSATADFEIVNRGTEAIDNLLKCCRELLQTHPIRNAGPDPDPFLDYLVRLSLRREPIK